MLRCCSESPDELDYSATHPNANPRQASRPVHGDQEKELEANVAPKINTPSIALFLLHRSAGGGPLGSEG